MVMTIRESPVVAVAELVIRLTPGPVAERAIRSLGQHDKTFLVIVVLLLLAPVFAWAGRLARRSWWAPAIVFGALAVLGRRRGRGRSAGAAPSTAADRGRVRDLAGLPVAADRAAARARRGAPPGRPRRPPATRPTPARRGAYPARLPAGRGRDAAVAAALGLVGRRCGPAAAATWRRAAGCCGSRGSRRPRLPAGVRVGLTGITPWMTPLTDVLPDPHRDRGAGDRARRTGACASTAWSTARSCSPTGSLLDRAPHRGLDHAQLRLQRGRRPADRQRLVERRPRSPTCSREAGVQDGADAVLQTSDDGWTCGTPLSALTDDRDAMLAVAMNGQPLPIEHGFPVRTVVPGLYGYVSACKWVVDLEVTRFDRISAYWTAARLGRARARSSCPRASTSRSPAPRSTPARPGSAAWPGRSTPASRRSRSPSTAAPGSRPTLARTAHRRRLGAVAGDRRRSTRATTSCGSAPPTSTGLVQTGVGADVLPDGATGWHTIDVDPPERRPDARRHPRRVPRRTRGTPRSGDV